MRRPEVIASLAVAPMALWLGWTTGWVLDPGQWDYTPTYRVPVAVAPPSSSPPSVPIVTTETVTLTETPPSRSAPTSEPTRAAEPVVAPTPAAVPVLVDVPVPHADEDLETDGHLPQCPTGTVGGCIPVQGAAPEAPYGCTEPDAEGLRTCDPGVGTSVPPETPTSGRVQP